MVTDHSVEAYERQPAADFLCPSHLRLCVGIILLLPLALSIYIHWDDLEADGWTAILIETGFFYIFWVGVTPLIQRVGRYWLLHANRPLLGLLLQLPILAALIAVEFTAVQIGLKLLTDNPLALDSTRDALKKHSPFLELHPLVYGTVLSLSMALQLGQKSGQSEAQRSNLSLELDRTRLELWNLQLQLQPHFLFNSLNAVSSMIHREPANAQRVLSRLAEFLRHVIKSSEEVVPLSEEMALVDMYLELERERFGHRLRYEYQIAKTVEDTFVPNLILQPLVENSIRYAVAPSVRPVTICISAQKKNERLELKVRDDGKEDGSGERCRKGLGVGLSNVQDRLSLMYGEAARFEAHHVDPNGFEVRIEIPLRNSLLENETITGS